MSSFHTVAPAKPAFFNHSRPPAFSSAFSSLFIVLLPRYTRLYQEGRLMDELSRESCIYRNDDLYRTVLIAAVATRAVATLRTNLTLTTVLIRTTSRLRLWTLWFQSIFAAEKLLPRAGRWIRVKKLMLGYIYIFWKILSVQVRLWHRSLSGGCRSTQLWEAYRSSESTPRLTTTYSLKLSSTFLLYI